MSRVNARNLIFGILAIVMMLSIFIFSSMPGDISGAQSSFITELLADILHASNRDLFIARYDYFVRKCAHMTEYAVLASLIFGALYGKDRDQRKYILFPVIICFLYALTDELHQVFVPGRSGNIFDVGVDTVGAAAMMLLILSLEMIIERRRKREGKRHG